MQQYKEPDWYNFLSHMSVPACGVDAAQPAVSEPGDRGADLWTALLGTRQQDAGIVGAGQLHSSLPEPHAGGHLLQGPPQHSGL